MAKKTKWYPHSVRFNADDERLFKKCHMRFIDLIRYAMKAKLAPVMQTTGAASLYLSNSTNPPQGKTDSLNPSIAPGAQTEHQAQDQKLEPRPAQAQAPALPLARPLPGAGLAEISQEPATTTPEPGPTIEQVPARVVESSTDIDELLEPAQAPHIIIARKETHAAVLRIMQKNTTNNFMQLPGR